MPSRKRLEETIFPSAQTLTQDFEWQALSTSFWTYFGAFQALVHNYATKALSQYEDCQIYQYEDICEDALASFKRMFEFCELEFDSETEVKLMRSTASQKKYTPGSYSLKRDTKAMASLWKARIEPEQLSLLKTAYLKLSPCYYCDDGDWS